MQAEGDQIMSFCPECGIDHHIADREAVAAADREVTLAKIHADRDIKIAQIGASSAAVLAETDNALEVARAEGKVEGMETVIESGGVDGQAAEPGGTGEPIVVESPAAEPVAELEPELAPPVIESSSPSSSSRSSGGGWWDGYGR
jgi:hypothetical protein